MRKRLCLFFILFITLNMVMAQDSTVHPYTESSPVKQKWYRSKLFKATILPAAFIAYGVSTIKDNGLYSSYDAKADAQRYFGGFNSSLDDHFLYVPYIELLILNLSQIGSRNDWINTSLLILKSELVMVTTVFGLKYLTHIQRPDSSDFLSFPSGHTAEAFLAASIVHNEFRHKSQWYGVGAYAIATTVGVFRVLNNEHWQSDVFAGAGFGILSAHLAYLSHRHRWGRKEILFIPSLNKNMTGFYAAIRLKNRERNSIRTLPN